MKLTPEERDVLKRQLAEAEESFHKLMTGESVREFLDQNGERATFTAANAATLRGYIRDLRFRLGLCPGSDAPLRFLF